MRIYGLLSVRKFTQGPGSRFVLTVMEINTSTKLIRHKLKCLKFAAWRKR